MNGCDHIVSHVITSCHVWLYQRGHVVVDWQCRGSNGKAKIEGYSRVSDEEAHHRFSKFGLWGIPQILCYTILYIVLPYDWKDCGLRET